MPGLIKGPADLEQFRTKVHNARWYVDPLPPDGKWQPFSDPVPAVTTIKGAWKKPFRKRHESSGRTYPLDSYQAAQYVQDNFAELAAMHPEQRFTMVATAPERSLAKAGDRGTAVHSVFEGFAEGIGVAPELFDDEVRPFIPACEKFVSEWRPRWRMSEFLVVSRQLGFAGTADALVDFPGVRCPSCDEPFGLTVVDYKSRGSRHGAYEEEICQLGGYASGDYIVVTGENGQLERRDAPDIDHGAIVSLMPDGTYQVYPVEIDAARHAFLGLFETWRIRRDGERIARTAVGKPAPVPSRRDEDEDKAGVPEGVQHADSEQHRSEQTPPVNHVEQHEAVKDVRNEGGNLPRGDSEPGEPFGGDNPEAVNAWLRGRVLTIVQSGKPLPVAWPMTTPTFKSGNVTAAHFAAIERWCDDTEKLLGLPFPPEDPRPPILPAVTIVPDPPSEPRRDPLGEATSWADKGRGLLALLDDEPLARACARLAGCETVRMTRERYLGLQAVVTQVSSPTGVLVASWGAGGVTIKPVDGIDKALLVQMPQESIITKATRTEAMKRGRRIAKFLGVPAAIKTYADLCDNLLLCACIAVGHGTNEDAA